MQLSKFTVKAASLSDAKSIKKLIDFYSFKNALLSKSEKKIKDEIESFLIVRPPQNYSSINLNSEEKKFTFAKAVLSNSTMSASQSHTNPKPPPLTKINANRLNTNLAENLSENESQFNIQSDIMGTIAVKKFNDRLYEIRSFAVWPKFQSFGIGNLLLEEAIKSVKQGRIFTLTFIPGYFERYAFQKIAKLSLPEKIWEDCLSCSFKEDCNETAMELIKV